MTDKTPDERLDRQRAHQWLNTAAVGIVLVAVISFTAPTSLASLVAMGAGFLIALVALFEVSRVLGAEPEDVEAPEEDVDEPPAETTESADPQEDPAA